MGLHANELPVAVSGWIEEYAAHTTEDWAQEYHLFLLDKIENPINLNDVNRESLEEFLFLSDTQIENLLEYRFDHAFFATPYELLLVKGFDFTTTSLLMPFVVATPLEDQEKISLKNIFIRGKHTAVQRFDYSFPAAIGYQKGIYLGKPWAGYLHYQFNEKHLTFSSTMEKDAGEPFTLPYNAGFDFYSGHVAVKEMGALKNLVIGDYTAQFGQGLVLGSGSTFSDEANLQAWGKRQDKLYGKKKGSETYFLRGIGVSLQSKHWQFSLLGSIKQIDLAQGTHRTPTELEKKDSGWTWMVGGNILARYTHFKIGCTFMYDAFTQLSFIGVDYRTYYKNFQFSGEIACNHLGKIATVHHLHIALHDALQMGLQCRYYAPGYNQAFGYATSIENTYKQGESGVFAGITWDVLPKLQVHANVDMAHKLSPQYRISKSSIAYKSQFTATYLFTQHMQLLAKWQWNKQERNALAGTDAILPTYPYTKNLLQIQFQGEFNGGFYLKSGWICRFFKYHTDPVCMGNVLFQDIGYKNSRWQLIGRLAFFDVPDYDNKITVYENDVLYAFSNTAYYGKGIRAYINAGVKPAKGWGIYLKIAHTFYTHQQQIGSGNDLIDGPHKTILHVVLQYKW
jgi:hypothetical protein